MARYVEGSDRRQVTMLPECLEDWIAEDNPVPAVDAFVEELDLTALGLGRAVPAGTGRPAYHPGALLNIYIYGYLNRVASSRRLERECQRNLELIWLTGRIAPAPNFDNTPNDERGAEELVAQSRLTTVQEFSRPLLHFGESHMMKLTSVCVIAFASSSFAYAADSACMAAAKEKKLSGAAQSAFVKKCEADAKAKCELAANEKKLGGAAKTSSIKKCVQDTGPAG